MRRHLVAASLLLALGAVCVGPAAVAQDVPYDDPRSVGLLTLCNRDLEPITSGPIDDRPTFWRAVSDTEAPAPYNDKNRRATLYYHLPRENVDPSQWPSQILTASSTYSNARYPIAQSTPIDLPLRVAVNAFPPKWDGFAQLRLYFSTQYQPLSMVYATADIQIEGDQWRLVRGGDAPCDAGKAVSPEVLLPDYEERVAKVERQQAKANPTSEPSAGASDGGGSTSDDPGGSADQSPAAAGDTSQSAADEGSSPWLWLVLGGAIVLMAGLGAAVFWIGRRP
jgi:hypothetical protein